MIIKMLLLLLIKLASIPLSFLPDHTPIAWPNVAWLGYVFSFFGMAGQWIHLNVLFSVVLLVLGIEGAILLYAVWRKIIGLVPTFA